MKTIFTAEDGREFCCPKDNESGFPNHVFRWYADLLVCDTCKQLAALISGLEPTRLLYGGKYFRCVNDTGRKPHTLGFMSDDKVWCRTCNAYCPLCATCGQRVDGKSCQCTTVPRGCRRCGMAVGSNHSGSCNFFEYGSGTKHAVKPSDTDIPGARYRSVPGNETGQIPITSGAASAAVAGRGNEPPVAFGPEAAVEAIVEAIASVAGQAPAPAETVNHPSHYNESPSGVECIDVVQFMTFNVGNAVKYCWRVGKKGPPIEDLRKAIWYLNAEIARLEKAK